MKRIMNQMRWSFCLFFLLLVSYASIAQTKNSKRGIAYALNSEADIAVLSKGISWWYNWYFAPNSNVSSIYQNYGMDFVPMTWDEGFNEVGIRAFYASHPNAKYLLGFNEPNFLRQANLSPKQAAALWPKLEKIADDYNLEIVGPAVNWCGECVKEGNINYSNPIQYLDSFFSACQGCRVDYIAVHNYMCYAGSLSGDLNAYKKYKKKLWLTEFACWDQATITVDMQKSYMMGALDFLDNDTMIYRYSWFNGREGTSPYMDLLKKEPGQLTELGKLYVNFSSTHDTSVFNDIPARIEAENYTLKTSGVQLQGTDDFDGEGNLGWITIGDWMQYNVNVPADGNYYIYLRLASTSNTSAIVREDGQELAVFTVNSTSGWQNWKTFVQQVNLPAGHHKLQVYAPNGGFNINWIAISDKANAAPSVSVGGKVSMTLPQNSASLTGTATDADGDTLTYKWVKSGGPTSFKVDPTYNDTLQLNGLLAGKYVFTLYVSDGKEVATAKVNVEVLNSTGIDDFGLENKVYPNPVGDILYIKTAENINGMIYVVDQSGRLLIQKEMNSQTNLQTIEFSKLEKGSYIVQVNNRNGITKNYNILK